MIPRWRDVKSVGDGYAADVRDASDSDGSGGDGGGEYSGGVSAYGVNAVGGGEDDYDGNSIDLPPPFCVR